TNRLTH
nr:pol protein (6 aa) [Feline sarcoma virus (STRAIN HARDY-ZUCKERMAN 4)]